MVVRLSVLVLPCSQSHHGIQQHTRKRFVTKMVQHGRLMEEGMMPVMDVAKILLYEILA